MISVLLCLFGIIVLSLLSFSACAWIGVRLIWKNSFIAILFMITAVSANFVLFMFLMKMFPIVEWLA